MSKTLLGQVISGLFLTKEAQPLISSKTLTINIHLHDQSVLTSVDNNLDMDTMSTLIQRLKPNPVTESWKAINRTSGLMWKVCAINYTMVRKPCHFAAHECIVNKISDEDFTKQNIKSISFAMVNVVLIKRRGAGMKPNIRAPSEDPKMWSSDYSGTFCQFLKDIYAPFEKGTVQMVNEEDKCITEATIIMPTAHSTTINVFWTETRYSYSNIPFPLFFSRVTSNVVMNDTWLDASRATKPIVLNERIAAAREQLGALTKWQETVFEIHRQLSRINRVYNPADHYNEQARRLLIDAVLLPVTEFANRTLSVETTLFEESTDKASIGWGPLDYVLYGEINDFVLTECVDPLPALPAGSKRTAGDALLHSGPKSSSSTEPVTKMRADEKDDDEEDEALSATVSKVGNMTLEAKQRLYMNAFGCVQTGGQMLDNHMLALSNRNCTVGSTVGCLSSGHEWVYFLLDTHTAGELPHFTLLGERSVSVFRATWDRAPPLKKGERRPSMKKITDFNVDLEHVTEVALAAYVALTGQLLKTPFA